MSVIGSRFAPVEEMIHGVLVRDPYRWLEDRSLPETEEWILEQQRRCDAYFGECEELPAIRERVREYLDVEVVDQPARVGGRYFYRRRARGQEQGCIYVRDAITGIERLLVDLSADGPFVSVGIHRVSNDGSLLAYERKHGGEDKKSIHIVDVETGVSLPYSVKRGYTCGFFFSPDNRGFFYSQELSENTDDHMIRFQLFDDSAAEQIVFRAARSRGSRLILSADSIHLGAIWIHEVDGDLVEDLWISQQGNPANWRQIFVGRKLPFSPILMDGQLFALSYENASNGKFVELTLEGDEARTIIQDQGAMIRQLTIGGGNVYIGLFTGLHFTIKSWRLKGDELPGIEFPKHGTVQLLPDLGDNSSIFLSYESFTNPLTIFEYVPGTSAPLIWAERRCHPSTMSAVARHVSYSSVDGTTIPITLVGDPSANGNSPISVIMTSDGGFGVPMTPQFSVLVSVLLECGVVLALPHIRGGGEFGNTWHDAGRGRDRQRSFDDFIAAAEWLCRKGISTPQQLAIFGGSNSGLLVGVALTQRPDLFRAVLCIAPLLDMVRYEYFDQASKWKEEYGSHDNEEEFHVLYAYSPYHRVSANAEYPAVLFVAGDKDDRCNPAHVRKMAALLSDSSSQNSRVLVDYSVERGHSPVLPLSARIEALARRIAFLCHELSLPFLKGDCHETDCV